MDQKKLWSLAATNGLILSIITIIAVTFGYAFELSKVVSLVISLVKSIGAILLLVYFMKDYSKQNESVSYSESFKYGFIICFCSAIVCTVITVLFTTVIFPESVNDSIAKGWEIAQSQGIQIPIDYDQFVKIMPWATALSTMFNCLLIGLIETLIIANWTKKENQFPTTPIE